ncbi:MAG TPA: hypothetical protein VND93_10005 [Myxococcales bacterium]|nr:hypothetical protein [Myxococcales bacterium]
MDQDLVIKTYSPAKSLGDARRRAALMLLIATGVALVPCALIFVAVLYGDWMTGAFHAIADLMFKQPVWAVLAATSPLAGALLVGYGYMQRAIRRRGAEREAATEKARELQ